jgi:hypothetical protein
VGVFFVFVCTVKTEIQFIPAKIRHMSFNTGDQSRHDLEARLDSILRDSGSRPPSTGESRPLDTVVTSPASSVKTEPELEAKKSPAKPFGDYLKSVASTLSKTAKAFQSWVLALVRRPKSEKGQGVIGKFFSKSKKVAGVRINKKIAIVAGGLSVVLAVGFTLLLNLSYVSVSGGIETTLGSSEDRTVLTLKASGASQGDLLVASLGVDDETGQEILIMGTVFSMNEQTYALYDGEVIWQITAEQIRGKVLFAEATETP